MTQNPLTLPNETELEKVLSSLKETIRKMDEITKQPPLVPIIFDPKALKALKKFSDKELKEHLALRKQMKKYLV